MEKRRTSSEINEQRRRRLRPIGAAAAALALFLAGCSTDAEKAEDVPTIEDITINCTADPDGRVSPTFNTLVAATVDIGDVEDINGELAWRSKNTIDIAGDGNFSVVADGFGPVTNYARVLESNRLSGDTSPSLANEETGAVLFLKAGASPDLSKYAPVTFTYTC